MPQSSAASKSSSPKEQNDSKEAAPAETKVSTVPNPCVFCWVHLLMNVEQSSIVIVNRKELFNFENRQLPPPKNHPAAFSMKTIQIGTFLLLLLQPDIFVV